MHLTYIKSSLVSYIFMLLAAKELLTEITHVPSLKRDSPSIIAFRRSGIGNRLNIAPTATGSVAAKIAPNKI